ncbi:uncharacterized mitochondrial protein AtMg00810-like [Rutidosis leptorrhynchoides]|uniref:uncharacterized mitochondrial protein AtMg00810-like n=1 Tax=Rutidosis leptorrhynchoides TaxID=125765 RepID=UPI003A9A0EFB
MPIRQESINKGCPKAFSSCMSPVDDTWYMDTGASAHLTSESGIKNVWWLMAKANNLVSIVLDVKNAFLHGDLMDTVYMHQPPGFHDPARPGYVCHLRKSLYGLNQDPRAWFHRFAQYALHVGFEHSRCDSSLFIYRHGTQIAYLLLYVDDIILTASSTSLSQKIITSLGKEFTMTNLGLLNYFLGISATRTKDGMFLSQQKYALDILDRADMINCKPYLTPVDTQSKLEPNGPPIADPTLYRSLAVALQYLTFTRPDITYVVQQLCMYMHDPWEPHFAALKLVLCYLRGSVNNGLQLYASSTTKLIYYSDAAWGGCPDTRRSTFGYCVFLGDNLLSWSSKRQSTISRSSAKAEYRAVANVVAETCWIRNLLLSTGAVRVLHVPSSSQYAEVFTKGLPKRLFIDFKSSLNVRTISFFPTAGVY